MVVFKAFKVLGFFILEALRSLLSMEGLCVGGRGLCQRHADSRVRASQIRLHWAAISGCLGLQHEKKKGIQFKGQKPFKILQKTWSILFVLWSGTWIQQDHRGRWH